MTLELNRKGVRLGQICIIFFFSLLSLSVILPVILTIIVSFSSEMSVITKGYSFVPLDWSLDAYKVVFSDNDILIAYGVTIEVTVIGTLISILITALAGYAMSQRKVKHRNKVALYFYLPTVVSSGVVAWYFNIANTLHLSNTIWALICPYLVNVFNIFLVRNYYKSIPESLGEAASIDGARPFKVFFSIMLPLSLPIMATITLFSSLGYWNDWYLATWFIDTSHKNMYPLQYYLFRLWDKMAGMGQESNISSQPVETVYVATMFVTMGPIVLVYPFVQKFFIKGITLGAVKG